VDDLSEPVFRLKGDLAFPSAHAAGPWDPRLQHGSAAASLVVRAAQRLAAAVPMRVARTTIDLMRPVPLAPLSVRGRVVREGRRIQVVEVVLCAGEVEVVRASVLKVRAAELSLPPQATAAPPVPPPPEAGHKPAELTGMRNPFLTGLSMRVIRGAFRSPGPAAVWFRAVRPIVEGEAISPAIRAAIAADFCNGISSVLDFDAWTFINGDLTLSLARDPVDEWILLEAETWLAPNGGGIAAGRLADRAGHFGRAVQSLVVEPRARG
jgi:Thioesterase-like superfamily